MKINIDKSSSYLEECSICLELLKKNVITLNCNHRFHTNCILNWTNNNNNLLYSHDKNFYIIKGLCPLCKKEYFKTFNVKKKCCSIL